jgi:hypothetical protein
MTRSVHKKFLSALVKHCSERVETAIHANCLAETDVRGMGSELGRLEASRKGCVWARQTGSGKWPASKHPIPACQITLRKNMLGISPVNKQPIPSTRSTLSLSTQDHW